MLYATHDYQGAAAIADRVAIIEAGRHQLRKVVDLDLEAGQGDQIWFRIPPERTFLFDTATGLSLRRKPVF